MDDQTGKLKGGFFIEKVIGSGKFGTVYKAYDVDEMISSASTTSNKIAIKMATPKDANAKKVALNEINIYSNLGRSTDAEYPIIEYYTSFTEDEKLYIVMEYGKCNLYTLLKADKESRKTGGTSEAILSEKDKLKLGFEISRGVEFLHSRKIIHRDIKPENIIILSSGKAKICDFGLSVIYDESHPPVESVGSVDYLSPEVLKCSRTPKAYGLETDLWSLGVLIYELFVGRTPFYHTIIRETMLNILIFNDVVTYPQGKVPPMSVCRLVSQLLKCNPENRKLDLGSTLLLDDLETDEVSEKEFLFL